MPKITPEKTHSLLEKLAEYVMNEVSTKKEVDGKIEKIDSKIDKLAEYVMTEIPLIKNKLDEKADKKELQMLLDGQDKIVKELGGIRIE